MKYYLWGGILIAACLLVIQFEMLLVMNLQKSNLDLWSSQIGLNESLIAACNNAHGQ